MHGRTCGCLCCALPLLGARAEAREYPPGCPVVCGPGWAPSSVILFVTAGQAAAFSQEVGAPAGPMWVRVRDSWGALYPPAPCPPRAPPPGAVLCADARCGQHGLCTVGGTSCPTFVLPPARQPDMWPAASVPPPSLTVKAELNHGLSQWATGEATSFCPHFLYTPVPGLLNSAVL